MKLIRKTKIIDTSPYWDMTIPKNHNYVLANGNVVHNTGVGFSVESKYTDQLPIVAEDFHPSDTTIVVSDSKLGWAKALKELIHLLYSGQVPKWDMTRVRPAGAPLKTFGGRASGPAPLNDLFNFCVNIWKKANGRRLTTLECHDVVCKIAEVVVVGGVRRSALISLSDLSDDRMRMAKSGDWWKDNIQRALANNSYVSKENIDVGIFMKEWLSLYESHSGERGIFSRTASRKQAEKYGRRDPNHEWGCNPCCIVGSSEIITQTHGKITIKEVVELFTKEKTIQVLAFNTHTEKVEWSPIEAAQLTRPNAELIEIEIDTIHGVKVIRCTPDHPIYTKNRGYVRADELTEDDDLVNISSGAERMETATIAGKMKSRKIMTNEDTYDIQTTTHNFFANDVLVHNSEIILRSREFCNLTEVVIRGDDNLETLKEKVRNATILGVFQSTLTNFRYLSKKWKENCEEERLLGVSLTGIMDNEYTNGKKGNLESFLNDLRTVAQNTAKEWAEKIGIPFSAAITCVKPSGTVSQLVDAASGIHARHSPYYVRTVRADVKDPLAKMMIDMGFPAQPDVTKPDHTLVFSFPIKSPNNAVYRTDMAAIEQLEIWMMYQRYWCEHKPSVTISVKEHEWPEVGAWVWKNLDEMSGVSFLPFSDHVYQQAPYQDCTKEEYEEMLSMMPKTIDWTKLSEYENTDLTEGAQTLACVSGSCEL